MAENSFRPARRSEAKPLIGVYAESGCGKTFGALVLARGYVGPKGRIAMIETESGRGEAYADPSEYPEIGGYDVASLRDSFSPKAYLEKIKAAEGAGYDCLIIDSCSHEWEGGDGVLAMAAENESKGLKGVLVWQQPKIQHQRNFILPITQTSIPLVICAMRAHYPMQQVRKQGKMEWERSDRLKPKQSEDILHEMFLHGWIDEAHNFHVTKNTNRGLDSVFADGKPLTVETGAKLRQWADMRARPDETPKVSEAPKTSVSPQGNDVDPAPTPSPYVILKQGGESPCDNIQQWRERMLKGISLSAPHQAQALWDRNRKLMAKYAQSCPGDVATVIDAFEEKCGK